MGGRFYVHFVPQVHELIAEGRAHGNAGGARQVEALLDETLNSELHQWFLGRMSAEEKARRDADRQEFLQRYAGEE